MNWKKTVAICLFCGLFVPQDGAAGPEYDPAWNLKEWEIKRVNDGGIVTHKSSSADYTRQIHAYLVIKAPAEQVFSLVTDYERLPEFMPNLEAVKVLESSSQGALVNYMLGLPFGVKKRYRLQLDYDRETGDPRMAWNLAPWPELKADETIAATTGYWLFKPAADKDATLLVYYNKTDPGDVPFGLGWIVDYLTNKTVVELLEKTKERAEQRWLESNIQ